MYWLAVTFGIAVVAMFVTGGRPGRLLSVPVQALWLLVLGLGIQVALEFVDLSADRIDDLGFGLLMLSYALLLAFAIVNFRLRGMAIITVGLAMNAIAIGLNEGMPTRDQLVETRTGREVERPVERTVKERPESDDDLAPFLGQIIRVPENPVDESLAPGDLVIAVGVVVFFVAGGRYRRPRTRTATPQEEEEPEQEEEQETAMVEATALRDPTPQPPPVPEPPPAPEPPPVPAPPPQPEPPPPPVPPEPAAAEAASAKTRTAAEEWEAWRAELRELAGDIDGDIDGDDTAA